MELFILMLGIITTILYIIFLIINVGEYEFGFISLISVAIVVFWLLYIKTYC